MSLAVKRLTAERKSWRKDHPHAFYARPEKNPDGSLNMLVWKCGIPGKTGTLWDGAIYPLTCTFTEEYPSKPPKCAFQSGFFHPNVFPSGTVCLSILNEEDGWKPGITIKQILQGIQTLLDTPNPMDPAQEEAFRLLLHNRAEYERKVLEQAKRFATTSPS